MPDQIIGNEDQRQERSDWHRSIEKSDWPIEHGRFLIPGPNGNSDTIPDDQYEDRANQDMDRNLQPPSSDRRQKQSDNLYNAHMR
jgi:hypothetical protein